MAWLMPCCSSIGGPVSRSRSEYTHCRCLALDRESLRTPELLVYLLTLRGSLNGMKRVYGLTIFSRLVFLIFLQIVSFHLNEYEEARDLILAQDKNYPV
jgi:hypothetical protein